MPRISIKLPNRMWPTNVAVGNYYDVHVYLITDHTLLVPVTVTLNHSTSKHSLWDSVSIPVYQSLFIVDGISSSFIWLLIALVCCLYTVWLLPGFWHCFRIKYWICLQALLYLHLRLYLPSDLHYITSHPGLLLFKVKSAIRNHH